MAQYFYMSGSRQLGPFSLNELKEKGLTADTFVWSEGQTDWLKASEISALSSILMNSPPPFKPSSPPMSAPSGPSATVTRKNSNSGRGLDIVLLIALAYWFFMALVNLVLKEVVDTWYEEPWVYIQIGMSLIFVFVPFAFAISVKNQSMKLIAIILAGLIGLNLIYQNINWLTSYL